MEVVCTIFPIFNRIIQIKLFLMKKRFLLLAAMALFACTDKDQISWTNQYNICWNSQGTDATCSMPLGGGSLGLNVWVENNDLLFYIGHPDSRLENQKLIKLGRIRMSFTPFVFEKDFSQTLNLAESTITIKGSTKEGQAAELTLWVDVDNPVVHAALISEKPVKVEVAYESWFFSAGKTAGGLEWNYRLEDAKCDLTGKIKTQKLEPLADMIQNPLKGIILGGRIVAGGLEYAGDGEGVYMNTPFRSWKTATKEPVKDFDMRVLLMVSHEPSVESWRASLDQLEAKTAGSGDSDRKRTRAWWKAFWDRSHIVINPASDSSDEAWKAGRNYQLFRYMLGCNSTGKSPTLFNGGIFTFDNPLSDYSAFGSAAPNPDERAWWDCIYMAQNQRHLYWPMIKAGDFDLIKPGLDFYRRLAPLAEARSKHFFGVEGTPFPESIDNYGIMAACPSDFGHHGCHHLTWHYTTSLEFAFMMLENYRFSGSDFRESLPVIMGVLKFYDNFYRKECLKLTGSPLNERGKLVIYPGSACEFGVETKNHADAIAGLMALTEGLLSLRNNELSDEEKEWLLSFRATIPDMPVKRKNGVEYIAVADTMKQIANPNEFTQLYALFPFHIYGVGMPGLELAMNTWKYGAVDTVMQKEFMCWKYPNIAVACLGLAGESKEYALNKLLYPRNMPVMASHYGNCSRFVARFPAFYVTYPFDAFPCMDHGGSSMTGLQEMLMQTPGNKIILLPAWPSEWDVDFRLHAPHGTVVEGKVRAGNVISLVVTPEARKKDITVSTPFIYNNQ
jgi:hypothetical protein